MRFLAVVGFPALVALQGCADPAQRPPNEEATRPPLGAEPIRLERSAWWDEVERRIENANHAFAHDGKRFSARVPAQELRGVFDQDGTVLTRGTDAVEVRLVGWGRDGALKEVEPIQPQLGACTDREDPTGACIRRLERPSGPLTEWWTATAEGFEQGFTIEQLPDGDGDLVLALEVAGASVALAGDDLQLGGDAGEDLLVRGLAAWDATGRVLPARFTLEGGGPSIRVDDRGAVPPITVDPIYLSLEATLSPPEGGSTTGLGSAFSSRSDFNGDGHVDLAVGADQARTYGRVFVYLGSATGLSGTAALEIGDGTSSGCFGIVLDDAGDVNGDSYDDLIVGDSCDDTRYPDSGRAYVFLGGPAGMQTTPAMTWIGTDGADLGTTVAGLGDVNGDGYDDVAVGVPDAPSTRGSVDVYYGSATGPAASPSVTYLGSSTYTDYGTLLSSAGDVNNDGYGDLIVGDRTGAAKLDLYFGGSGGLSTSFAATTLTWPSAFLAADGGGDVNGDGYDDVVIGNYFSGQAIVYHGSASGLTQVSSLSSATTFYGCVATIAGDVNGDGYDDVAVGASGQASVYFGTSAGVSAASPTLLTGAGKFGRTLSGVGDLDGDGFDDLAVGATDASPGGAFSVFAGSPSGPGTVPALTVEGRSNPMFGSRFAGVGDINDDGYDDVLIGAVSVGDYSGAAYLFAGSASGLSTTPTTVLSGSGPGVYFGSALGGGGDVDGDGYDDIVVSAPYAPPAGQVFVYRGSAAGLVPTPLSTLTASSPAEFFGGAADIAGDVNGDGYADVIVGDQRWGSYGAWFVHHGSPSGASPTAALTVTAPSTYELLGSQVAGLGDVNGDGFDDVAVSDPSYGNGAGRVEVFLGSSAGVDATPNLTLNGATSSASLRAVDSAGDVNGDGYADLVVGAVGQRKAWVFYGSAVGLSSASTTTVSGTVAHFGAEVCGAGDLDGDGYDDVAVRSGEDEVQIFAGSPVGLGVVPSLTLVGEAGSGFGVTLDGAGDVDGDGAGELAVGALYYDGSTGLVAIYGDIGDGDGDGDGYPDAEDCDDGDAAIHPGAVEVCDAANTDEDCDGLSDDADTSVDAEGSVTWYADADGDGFGSGAALLACDPPPGHALISGDCDDENDAISPAAVEACDPAALDEDCDGLHDDADPSVDPATRSAWYRDADADGYGDPGTATFACAAPSGFIEDGSDCNDSAATLSPAAQEVPDDGVDQDCDGFDTCRADADGDGYASDALVVTSDGDCTDAGEASSAAPSGDCDDGEPAIHPGAPETDCTDPTDYNCDGSFGSTDADGDGYLACADCRDDAPGVSPGAAEICDGVDQDCDGTADEGAIDGTLWYVDADSDGYIDPASGVSACVAPDGYTVRSAEDDCDDTDASSFPGAEEVVADGADQDCDGDELCWLDADGDGWRPDTTATIASADLDCDDLGEATSDASTGDCLDDNGEAWPGAPEIPDDGVDQDCDGVDQTSDPSDSGTTDTPSTDNESDDDTEGQDKASEGCGCDNQKSQVPPGLAALGLALILRRRTSPRRPGLAR